MRIPSILEHYLETTDQYGRYSEGGFTKEDLLKEAEWCLYNATENEASRAYEFSAQSKVALKRFVEKLRSECRPQ